MAALHFKSMNEALSQPQSKHFWSSKNGSKTETGNAESFYAGKLDGHLTFDISNHKVLVNMDYKGSLKHISMFRSCYRTDYAPGIWTFKDYSTTGPYTFSIKIDGRVHSLDKVDWPFKTSVLDNIFPISTILSEKLKLTLVAFCPISEDGTKRPRAAVYGLMVENVSGKAVAGSVILPKVAATDEFVSVYNGANVYAVVTLADRVNAGEVSFDLCPGQSAWVASIITAPGSMDADEINKLGTLYWFSSTWSYYRSVAGELEMPEDSFTAEFFKRAVCQCLEFVDMDEEDNIVGATWGTYPTTPCIWGKDFNYGSMPLFMFEPELYKKCMLWSYQYSVRHKSNRFEGGVLHSIGNSLAPVSMAGFYYSSTADKEFFLNRPEIKTKSIELLDEVIKSRKDKNVWLFPSKFVSDGVSSGDYHTGSNIFIWFCLTSFARILKEVYKEEDLAADYSGIAAEMKEAIEAKCVIEGPFGKQYIEGVNADGTVPRMEHEGEESDTTLIPVYGYASYDNETYKNYTRFALSEHNEAYNPETRGIKWGNDATMTGFVTGFANITDEASMNSDTGFMREIRRLTDMDGSIWWWPYVTGEKYGNVCRIMDQDFNKFFGSMDVSDYPGKCAWASGVYASIFVQEILGVKYDAPEKTLYFRPFSPSSSFRWERFRIGNGQFGVSFSRTAASTEVEIVNNNNFGVNYNLEIPNMENKEVSSVTKNSNDFVQYTVGCFLNRPTIIAVDRLLPYESVTYRVNV